MACLYWVGKTPSASERLTMEVMGWIRASRHALSREVGMISREHVASDDWSMAALISSVEQGAKVARRGGAGFGERSG
jgi:hypothetical protein